MKKDMKRQQTRDRDRKTSDRGKAGRCISVQGENRKKESAGSCLKPAFLRVYPSFGASWVFSQNSRKDHRSVQGNLVCRPNGNVSFPRSEDASPNHSIPV